MKRVVQVRGDLLLELVGLSARQAAHGRITGPRGISGLGFPALCIAGSYGNKPEPIPFLRILAVSDRDDLRGE
jgi:hypothetical protein